MDAVQDGGNVRARSPRRALWTGTDRSQIDTLHGQRAVARGTPILLAIAVVQVGGDEGATLAQTGGSLPVEIIQPRASPNAPAGARDLVAVLVLGIAVGI